MPKIMPITVLEDSSTISDACLASKEPIFLTRNGYGNMVIMNIDIYEALVDTKRKRDTETQTDAEIALQNLKSRFGL